MVVVVVYCCPPAATTGRFGVIELTAAAVRWRAVVTPLDADSRLLKTIINAKTSVTRSDMRSGS